MIEKEADVLDGTQRELMEQPILEGKYQKKYLGIRLLRIYRERIGLF